MIKAKHIYKNFGKLEILKNVNLHIQKSEVVAIMGASGAGKSTLLHILSTLDKPSKKKNIQTSIEIDGCELSKLNDKKLSKFRNQHIGFVFQSALLLPEFSALENVLLPAKIAGDDSEETKNKALELLNFLNVSHRIHHKPSELSGGEAGRVAIARALINNPKVIFADEPSGNLDLENAKKLHELFFELREKFDQTFLIVTHNQELASMCDRKLEIKEASLI